MKRNMFGALMTLIVAFAVATPTVHAQSTILTANVPFAFNVGQQSLPAGAYAVRETDRATLIESKDGHDKVLGLYPYAEPSKADETKLVFDKIGNSYFLREIWTSARGQGLEIPESNLEKELQAANVAIPGGDDTVIVALR